MKITQEEASYQLSEIISDASHAGDIWKVHDNLDLDRVRIHAPSDAQSLCFGVQKPQQASHPQPSCCFRQGDSRNLDSNKYKKPKGPKKLIEAPHWRLEDFGHSE